MKNLFQKTLFDHKKGLMFWVLGILASDLIITSFFPTVKKMPELMNEYVESFPKEISVWFGDLSSIGTPEGFLNVELFSFMFPFAFIAYAITVGTNIIAGEEKNKTIDILISNPIKRSTLIIQKFLAMATLITIFCFIAWFGFVLVTPIMKVNLFNLAQMCINLALITIFFGSISILTGSITGKTGISTGLSGGLAFITFLINGLAKLSSDFESIKYISPFFYYSDSNALFNGINIMHFLILISSIALIIYLSIYFYKDRELGV